MSTSLVSVLMPAYNCEEYISKAIDSILNQSYTNFELLIADDCSIDNTKVIIDSYKDKRIKTYHNHINQGYLKASNLLFSRCSGEFITFQDADDWSNFNRIDILLNKFEEDKDIGCIGSFVKKVNYDGNFISDINFKIDAKEIKQDIPTYFNCVGSALMIRRQVLEKIKGYNIYFDRVGSEDLYWYGLIVNQFKTINIPMYLYNYRSNPNSVSNDKNMSIKKQASKEIAIEALKYYLSKGEEIFHNKIALNATQLFLFGKYYCWNGKYKKGLCLLLKSLLLSPFRAKEITILFRIYLPKLIFK